jgi:hypothetical protein
MLGRRAAAPNTLYIGRRTCRIPTGNNLLQRFVEREPLRRVHECVFGVQALESESVDPRL